MRWMKLVPLWVVAFTACPDESPSDTKDASAALDGGQRDAGALADAALPSSSDASVADASQPADAAQVMDAAVDCSSGQTEQSACGLNARGVQQRTCVDGVWGAWTACEDPDACLDGVEESENCNQLGERTRRCVEGQWSEFADCTMPPPFASVTVGRGRACGVRADGAIACSELEGRREFTGVAVHAHGTCGLSTGGDAICAWEQDGAQGEFTVPGPFQLLESVPDDDLICAIRDNGTLACWDAFNAPVTPPVSGTFRDLSMRAPHGCALRTSGELACWSNAGSYPYAVPTGAYLRVAVHDTHACAITTSGSVTCWGPEGAPELVVPAGTFKDIAVGAGQGCALHMDGRVSCWGTTPLTGLLPPDGAFEALDASGDLTCGLRSDGFISCWATYRGDEATVPWVEPSNSCGFMGPLPVCGCGTSLSCSRTVGYQCRDVDNTPAMPITLPRVADSEDDFKPAAGNLSFFDEDWYRVPVTDSSLGNLQPEVTLTPPSDHRYGLCVYYLRDDGVPLQSNTCNAVAIINNQSVRGCCAQGAPGAPVSLNVTYLTGLGDDTGSAYFRVHRLSGPSSCGSYQLEYRF